VFASASEARRRKASDQTFAASTGFLAVSTRIVNAVIIGHTAAWLSRRQGMVI